MDRVFYPGLEKILLRFAIALTVIAGFFSGYTSHATSPLRSRTQTEWVESRKTRKKVRNVFETGNNAHKEFDKLSTQNEFFILLDQNRLTLVFFKANNKLVQSIISGIRFLHFKLRPQLSDEYFISA